MDDLAELPSGTGSPQQQPGSPTLRGYGRWDPHESVDKAYVKDVWEARDWKAMEEIYWAYNTLAFYKLQTPKNTRAQMNRLGMFCGGTNLQSNQFLHDDKHREKWMTSLATEA